MKQGIYKITNLTTGQFYIGSSVDIKKRERYHFWQLKENRHHNTILQNSFNKYGLDNFRFEIVEIVIDRHKIKEREQYYIDTLKPSYNIRMDAQNAIEYSAESKERIRLSQIGRTFSKQTIEKMSIAQLGKVIPAETRERISTGLKKYFNKNGSPNKGRIGNRAGMKLTKEEIERRTATRKANNNYKCSDEKRQKMLKPVLQIDPITMIVVAEWPSVKSAQDGLSITGISERCYDGKKAKGFIWKHKNIKEAC